MSDKKYVKTVAVYTHKKETDAIRACYSKVSCDSLTYFNKGKSIKLDNKELLNFYKRSEYLDHLKYRLEKGTLPQTAYDKLVNVPDFVLGFITTLDDVRLYEVVQTRAGGTTIKVSAERLIAESRGFEVEYNRGDYQDLLDKENQLQKQAFLLENDYIDNAKYQENIERINNIPDFVFLEVGGKGSVL